MRLIVHPELNPFYNMAVDEAILESCRQNDPPTLRFYEWEGIPVSIGYFQPAETVKTSLSMPDCLIVRRPTGGGAVVHNNDITFSIVFPETLLNRSIIDSYKQINLSIIEKIGLQKNLHLIDTDNPTQKKQKRPGLCFDEPTRYDIIRGNIKVGGSAQRRKKGIVLHQSSFFYDKCGYTRSDYVQVIEKAMESLFNQNLSIQKLTDTEEKLANQLLINRYSKPTWNYHR